MMMMMMMMMMILMLIASLDKISSLYLYYHMTSHPYPMPPIPSLVWVDKPTNTNNDNNNNDPSNDDNNNTDDIA